jgi:hypothetical protein
MMRGFIICTLTKYYYIDQIRCDGAVACKGKDENCIQYFNWKTLLEELSADGKLILKSILQKQCEIMGTEFIWPSKGERQHLKIL